MGRSKKQQNREVKPSKYKTTLCQFFVKGEGCQFGEKCAFAHGEDELRPEMEVVPHQTEDAAPQGSNNTTHSMNTAAVLAFPPAAESHSGGDTASSAVLPPHQPQPQLSMGNAVPSPHHLHHAAAATPTMIPTMIVVPVGNSYVYYQAVLPPHHPQQQHPHAPFLHLPQPQHQPYLQYAESTPLLTPAQHQAVYFAQPQQQQTSQQQQQHMVMGGTNGTYHVVAPTAFPQQQPHAATTTESVVIAKPMNGWSMPSPAYNTEAWPVSAPLSSAASSLSGRGTAEHPSTATGTPSGTGAPDSSYDFFSDRGNLCFVPEQALY